MIYAENRSFDHLYGLFPGAEGIANATAEQKTQLDHDGTPLPHLPPVYDARQARSALSRRRCRTARSASTRRRSTRRLDEVLPSPCTSTTRTSEQINGGRNNMFVAMTNVGGWAMGYFDGSKMKMWKWAQEYTLADHFFMGAFGGSYLNHQWLVCACTPMDPNAPAAMRAQLDERRQAEEEARLARVGAAGAGAGVRRPGLARRLSPSTPRSRRTSRAASRRAAAATSISPTPRRHPGAAVQTQKTIGDTLSAKGVSWAWYAGGWDAALADGRQDPKAKRTVIYNRGAGSPIFQPHHQPFNYYARFAPGSADRARHLKDEQGVARGDRRGHAAAGGVLQARRAATPSIRATPT